MKSKHAMITINDSVWTELVESFDISFWSIYSDVAIYVQEYGISGWGDSISVSAETSYSVNTSVQKIRVKSQSGSATVNYSLLGFITYRLEGVNPEEVYLKKDGSNADETIDVGSEDIHTTGELRGGTAKFGLGINHTEFEADGTLKFNENATVWDDINISAIILPLPVSNQPSKVSLDTTDIEVYSFDNGSLCELSGGFEIKHGYKEGSDIIAHAHIYPQNTNIGNIELKIDYWIRRGNSILLTGTLTKIQATNGVAWEEIRIDLGTIVGSSVKIGAQAHFRVYRDARVSNSNDTYVGDVAIGTVGLHYEIDTIGSRQITTK